MNLLSEFLDRNCIVLPACAIQAFAQPHAIGVWSDIEIGD